MQRRIPRTCRIPLIFLSLGPALLCVATHRQAESLWGGPSGEQKSNKELAPAGQQDKWERDNRRQWTQRERTNMGTSRLFLARWSWPGSSGGWFFTLVDKTGELLPVVVCLFGRFGACSLFSARFVLPCPLFILRSCFQCFAELQTILYFILSSLGILTIVYRACFAMLEPAVDTVAMVCAQTVQSSYRAA